MQALLSLALVCMALLATSCLMSQTMELDFNKPRFNTEITTSEAMKAIAAQDARADGTYVAPIMEARRRLHNRNVGYVLVGALGTLQMNNEGNDAPAVVVVSLTGIVALVDNLVTNNKKQ